MFKNFNKYLLHDFMGTKIVCKMKYYLYYNVQ